MQVSRRPNVQLGGSLGLMEVPQSAGFVEPVSDIDNLASVTVHDLMLGEEVVVGGLCHISILAHKIGRRKPLESLSSGAAQLRISLQ